MSVYEHATTVLARDARIWPLFKQTSPGDRSVLPAMLDRENGAALTSPGSPNDQLWSCFAEHGWMEAIPDPGIPMPRFGLTEAGRRALPVILALLYGEAAGT